MAKDPEDDVIVNLEDDLFHRTDHQDPARKVGDYKPTNMPLSKAEIEHDEALDKGNEGWAPRTTENIGDMVPLPEKPGPSSDID